MQQDQSTTSSSASPEWEQLQPVLDSAMGQLSLKDRNAVLLRFFEGKSFRIVGAALGLSEDAAQKRVSRALQSLRSVLVRQGVTVSSASLSACLTASAVQPAATPAIMHTVASASLAGASGKIGLGAWLAHTVFRAKAALIAASVIGSIAGIGLVTAAYLRPPAQRQFVTTDLSGHFNGSLDAVWVPGFDRGSHLASLPHGRHLFADVPFQVDGVIQLQGQAWKSNGYPFPEQVTGISVNGLCHRIHLLHANSAFTDPPGTVVARLVLNYRDGSRQDFAIRQNEQILDWWVWPSQKRKPTDRNTVVAWTGQNPATAARGLGLRMFKTAFVNPHPDREVQTIDYVSGMAGSAPFMVGLTLEK